jgi:hypothetical protein
MGVLSVVLAKIPHHMDALTLRCEVRIRIREAPVVENLDH